MSTPTALPSTADWAAAPLRDLIRHIVVEHHGYLRRRLPEITEPVNAAGNEALITAFNELRSELTEHLDREESELFPAIDRFESAVLSGEPLPAPYFGSVRGPIATMQQDHEIAAGSLAQLIQLAKDLEGTLGDALRELSADVETHIRLETEILFPRALRLDTQN